MGVNLQGLEAESFDRVTRTLTDQLAPEQLRDISDRAADLPLDAILDAAMAELETARQASISAKAGPPGVR
jgi:hypothetical protein